MGTQKRRDESTDSGFEDSGKAFQSDLDSLYGVPEEDPESRTPDNKMEE